MAVEPVAEFSEVSLPTATGLYRLHRFPLRKKDNLRAWDAADEYLLDHLEKNGLLHPDMHLLIVNDSFGALSIPLNQYRPVVMTDSYLSMQGISANLKLNAIDYESVTIINSLHEPEEILQDTADLVLLRIPKNLAMLEDQLHRIRPSLGASTTIIATGMTKNIHLSTLQLFESIIGPSRTSLARKKARLIFSQLDETLAVPENPYPTSYPLAQYSLELSCHASLFSTDSLDIGSRFFIDNLPADNSYDSIVDLGCGNGVVGIVAAIKNPAARLVFTDESYMAVESAISNFVTAFGETREAEFLQTDCLHGVPDNSVSLILCNPPFHQNNAINDDVAWQMFSESRTALRPQAQLWVIGNRHLAYHAKLKHLFGNCEVVASNKKFALHKAVKK